MTSSLSSKKHGRRNREKRFGSEDQASNSKTFQAKIGLSSLKELKSYFDEAEENGERVDEESFVSACSRTLGAGLTEEELKSRFMHMDSRASGAIDWDEFSTYLLLEGQQTSAERQSSQYVLGNMRQPQRGESHTNMITRILVHQRHGKYYTTGRDGTVRVWNANTCEYESTLHTSKSWITDACWLRGEQRICFSSMNMSLSIYDVGSEELYRQCLSHMSAENFKPTAKQKSSQESAVGSNDGNVNVRKKARVEPITLQSFTEPATCVQWCGHEDRELMVLGLKNGTLMAYPNLLHPGVNLAQPAVINHLHNGFISKMVYANILDTVITSSWDTSIKLFSLETNTVLRTLGGSANTFGHQKSVFSFDWSPEMKLIASCGSERHVYFWNPFIPNPVFKLTGHTAPLVDVVFTNEELITLSVDKVMKVWDLRTFGCIQTISDPNQHYPENSLSAMTYDHKRQRIVTAASHPGVWPMRREVSRFPPEYTGHVKPIVTALYNEPFHQIVSVDPEAVITWDADTGRQVFKFLVGDHFQDEDDCVTCAAFDQPCRRLITGFRSGKLLLWNYINGNLVKEFQRASHQEALAALHFVNYIQSSQYIAFCSSDKILVYQDSESYREKLVRSWSPGKSSITSMIQCGPSLLAYATDSGLIFLYTVATGTVTGTIGGNAGPPFVSVEDMVYLKKGEPLLAVSRSDGCVQIWSIKERSMLLQFTEPGDSVFTKLTTSKEFVNLCAGDDRGIVTLWDISRIPKYSTNMVREMVVCNIQFRAHEAAISSVQLVHDRSFIVTSSVNCMCKMFTFDGVCVGHFGQLGRWNIQDSSTFSGEEALPMPTTGAQSPTSAHSFKPFLTQTGPQRSPKKEGNTSFAAPPLSPNSSSRGSASQSRASHGRPNTAPKEDEGAIDIDGLPQFSLFQARPPRTPSGVPFKGSKVKPYRRYSALKGIVKHPAQVTPTRASRGDPMPAARVYSTMNPPPLDAIFDNFTEDTGSQRSTHSDTPPWRLPGCASTPKFVGANGQSGLDAPPLPRNHPAYGVVRAIQPEPSPEPQPPSVPVGLRFVPVAPSYRQLQAKINLLQSFRQDMDQPSKQDTPRSSRAPRNNHRNGPPLNILS